MYQSSTAAAVCRTIKKLKGIEKKRKYQSNSVDQSSTTAAVGRPTEKLRGIEK